jgi:transcriptional regulator with XRE-family HTH domain
MTFSAKVAEICADKGWTKAELARRCGVSKNTVGTWFQDEGKPFTESLLTLSRVLGVSCDFLADDSLDNPARAAPALSDAEQIALSLTRQIGVAEVLEVLYAMRSRRPQVAGPAVDVPVPGVTDIKRREERKA